MELFEFNNITQIVNRFKTVLKLKFKQIDFVKHIKKTASVFYNILNPKCHGKVSLNSFFNFIIFLSSNKQPLKSTYGNLF